MIRHFLFGTVAVLTTCAAVARADPKDDLQAAAQKLADSANYSWTTTTEGGFGGGQSDGKTEKDGFTTVSLTMRDNSYDVVMKGDKAAIKTDDGWKLASELLAPPPDGGGGGGPDPAMFVARMTQNYKAPAAQALDWVGNVQNVAATDDGFTADLTEDAAKKLLTFRRRPAPANADNNGDNAGPTISNAKASITFSVKDGVLTKTVLHLTGTVSFNGNDRDIDRTTTVEIKDVGATTVTVPDDAKAKLNS